MKSELDLGADQGLGDAAEVGDVDLPLGLGLLNVDDALRRDQQYALLVPPVHVDLLDLVRE